MASLFTEHNRSRKKAIFKENPKAYISMVLYGFSWTPQVQEGWVLRICKLFQNIKLSCMGVHSFSKSSLFLAGAAPQRYGQSGSVGTKRN